MKRTEQELRRTIQAARNELEVIESAKREKELGAYMGRCFKYRNNYSCPETAADYFYMYSLVVGIDGSSLKCFTFQTDKFENFSIQPQNDSYPGNLGSEIKRPEFNREWKKIVRRIELAAKRAMK